MSTPMPSIQRVNGQSRLIVDGAPFLILGVQWESDSCFSAEEMSPLFPHAAKLGANTATLPTYWREIEPETGRYVFTMLDERIRVARENGMRVIPLWFGTYKNGCLYYTPDWIQADPETYRLAVGRDGKQLVSLCPNCEATWQRDRDALKAIMAHLREVDDERTVIMFQIENEPGIFKSDRCHCPTCSERFSAGGYAETWGAHAAEAFSAASIATYVDRLSVEAKAIYPLPTYVNTWLSPEVGAHPGDYPSGGAVPHMLAHFRQHLKSIDLVSPDIYSTSYRNFHRLCAAYAADGNPLYISEHASSSGMRAERNVFYALGEFGALGFDPWAIDYSYPNNTGPALVDLVGGEWGPQAYSLRDSYVAIGRAIEPIVEAQGTGKIFTCVQEPGENVAGWAADGCDVLVSYHDREGAGRGLIIQRSPNEFLLIGLGFSVRFQRPSPDCRLVPVTGGEFGRFEGQQWRRLHPIRRQRPGMEGNGVSLREPSVARVWLDL
jgi:hypothetical protein